MFKGVAQFFCQHSAHSEELRIDTWPIWQMKMRKMYILYINKKQKRMDGWIDINTSCNKLWLGLFNTRVL